MPQSECVLKHPAKSAARASTTADSGDHDLAACVFGEKSDDDVPWLRGPFRKPHVLRGMRLAGRSDINESATAAELDMLVRVLSSLTGPSSTASVPLFSPGQNC